MTRSERLAAIRDRISQAAGRAGRSSDEVTLIAVSKTFPEEAILEVASFGQVAFGENKVQELVRKTDALGKGTPDQPLEWHHIGHLQRNKVKDVIGRVALFTLSIASGSGKPCKTDSKARIPLWTVWFR